MNPRLYAGSSRFLLFADVLAHLLQLEPDPVAREITAGREMLTGEMALFAARGYQKAQEAFAKIDNFLSKFGRKCLS
jgi:hypothetical protein